jgi:cytochrome c oxidase assembly factor CtaG
LADQQLGGLIMWIGTGTVYLGAMAYVFFRWAGGEDRAEKERYAAAARKAQAAREA